MKPQNTFVHTMHTCTCIRTHAYISVFEQPGSTLVEGDHIRVLILHVRIYMFVNARQNTHKFMLRSDNTCMHDKIPVQNARLATLLPSAACFAWP